MYLQDFFFCYQGFRSTHKNSLQGKKFCTAYNAHHHYSDHASTEQKIEVDPGESSNSSAISDGEEGEDFSDISDDSDIFHLCVNPQKNWTTEQDADEAKIEHIASLLRRNPFAPPDPDDPRAERDWEDTQSGVAVPRAHCAFRGCKWVNDSKDSCRTFSSDGIVRQR